jgi:Fe-S oxidoreductase
MVLHEKTLCLARGESDGEVAAAGYSFDEDGLAAEAARCIRCFCNGCSLFCDLIKYTGKQPPRIRDEIVATTLPGTSEVKHTPAKRMMNLCTQCGVCAEVCPEEINIGELILAGRQQMHRYGKAPWAFHDFFLRDMQHADGQDAAFSFMPAPRGGAVQDVSYVFFPGCQLGASDPSLVLRAYSALKDVDQDAGILLRCCGAPAEWSGVSEEHSRALDDLRLEWERLGRPVLLAACTTCIKQFEVYLPDIRVESVYEVLAAGGGALFFSEEISGAGLGRWAVFDPCSARNMRGVQLSVRKLAERAGLEPVELPLQSEIARCCGYGGQSAVADPAFAAGIARERAFESDLPYITYCINCRDYFARTGKRVRHILDLLPGAEPGAAGAAPGELPTVTERRRNREYLKRKLREAYACEPENDSDANYSPKKNNEKYDFSLLVPGGLRRKMDEARILEDEAYEVVDFIRRTGRQVYDPEKRTHSGYRKIGHMTYWVEYADGGAAGSLALVNVYAHRMAIDVEQIWNGHKTREEFLDE